MNYTLIGLGVILCVIIYVMYEYLTKKGNEVSTNMITLSASTLNPPVPYTSLSTPNSSRYFLSFWVNVNSITAETTIF
jgi:hypothetical protein